MEKFIKVYDDILSSNLVDYIEFLLKGSHLPFVYNENGTFPDNSPNRTIKPVLGYSYYPLNNYSTPHLFPILQILYEFSTKKNILVKNILRVSSYLDFPTSSSIPDFPPHIDRPEPHLVCLYYINDSDGDTIFFKNNQEVKRVSPKKGRIAFFDGSIYHCGSTPSKIPRAVINYNFIAENFGKEKEN